jgi:hypothetical protein
MQTIKKVIDWIIWGLIITSICGFVYGIYQLIDVFFIRG